MLGRYKIDLDLLSDAFRISASVNVKTSGILAELNSDYSDYLSLNAAYVSRLHDPGQILGHYRQTSFLKDNINLLVIMDPREEAVLGSVKAGSIYTRGRPVQATLTVAGFEIEGTVRHAGRGAPEATFVNTLGKFQPVFNAQAVASQYPSLNFRSALILVNKQRIGLFSLLESNGQRDKARVGHAEGNGWQR